ncbi:MAG: Crp/Fnr family transcriptional regulator [Dactylosporangium sp.]|nr:Crp/Fnr family transcriptional regulator [Dactylosporangium sp.]NNJ60843.1 Crp/Fnr family transcriptional regulator [Dactylosporangium sp.]
MAEDRLVRIMDVLTEGQRTALESLGEPIRYRADETIFREGQHPHWVLLIQSGSVKVTRVAADGAEMILAIRGVGEVMGDEGVLMGEPRSATVTTITEVVGIEVKAEDLLDFVGQHDLWPVMYRAAVQRGRQSDRRALLARLDVKSRLARWLLELAGEVGEPYPDGSMIIAATLSQQDLASRIGASREAVAIELRRMREQRLVTTGRQRIVLHDLDALRTISTSD